MNNRLLRWTLAGAATLVLCCGAWAGTAQAEDERQFYSEWKLHPKTGYYYRNYYYKPTYDCPKYEYTYVIYYPDRPDYCYYYDPHEKEYYGRCATDAAIPEEERWSGIVEEDRGPKLEQVPEESFQAPAAMPEIPGSDDGVTVAALPNDLPDVDGGPPAGGGDTIQPIPAPPGAGGGAPGGEPGGAPGGAPGGTPGGEPTPQRTPAQGEGAPRAP